LRREGAPEERCVDFIYQPLVEADGNVSGILVQGTDVTEKRRLEQRFFRVQRMESIGALAGGIAHDLNNLLMPIMMGANLLRRPATEEQRERAIRMIEQSAQRGSDFVNQILQFVRGVEAERRPVQVGDVLRELELMIDRTFPASVALDIDIEEDLWWIDGDATQLHQVLLNLCVNARDAMPLGGRLSIAASNAEVDLQYSLMHRGLVAGPYVRITVADTGVGIEPHVVEKMFDPLFTTRETEQGTGLGLSTVAAIVRRHGGTITVQSRPGKGSVFAVYLPVRTDVPVQQPAGPAAAVGRGAGELILVVDDDPAILAVMRETLEADGYRVATADDGARAVTVFAERRDEVALVLTDLQMPVVTGAMLTSALRRIDPSVRVIVSSGALAGDSAPEADAVLHKPYSSDELLSAVAAVLGSGLRASG
jgi:two-component system cell cycle sensor histidine kinase/response regulator CckA